MPITFSPQLDKLLSALQPPPPATKVALPTTDPNPTTAKAILENSVDFLLSGLGLKQAEPSSNLGAKVGAVTGVLAGPALGALLDLSPEARAARAAEQGYTTDAYHGTRAKTAWYDDPELATLGAQRDLSPLEAAKRTITEFRVSPGGLKLMDGIGVHAGTPDAATQRLEQSAGWKFKWTNPDDSSKLAGSEVLPLKLKTQNPLTKRDGSPMTETELQAFLTRVAKKIDPELTTRRYSQRSPDAGLKATQAKVRDELIRRGYDSIPYVNSHEDRGSVSWIVLDPANVRSRWAAFDPEKAGSRNILASLVPMLAPSAPDQEEK